MKSLRLPILDSTRHNLWCLLAVFALMAIVLVFPTTDGKAEEPATTSKDTGSNTFQGSGSYEANANSTGYYLVTGLGEGIKSSVFKWSIHLTNVEGEGFLHDATGECFALVVFESDLSHQTGWCRYSDADGDLFYEQFEHDGILGKGGGKAIGGTGKYEGVTSSHHYEFDPQADEDEIDSVATRAGTYSFD